MMEKERDYSEPSSTASDATASLAPLEIGSTTVNNVQIDRLEVAAASTGGLTPEDNKEMERLQTELNLQLQTVSNLEDFELAESYFKRIINIRRQAFVKKAQKEPMMSTSISAASPLNNMKQGISPSAAPANPGQIPAAKKANDFVSSLKPVNYPTDFESFWYKPVEFNLSKELQYFPKLLLMLDSDKNPSDQINLWKFIDSLCIGLRVRNLAYKTLEYALLYLRDMEDGPLGNVSYRIEDLKVEYRAALTASGGADSPELQALRLAMFLLKPAGVLRNIQPLSFASPSSSSIEKPSIRKYVEARKYIKENKNAADMEAMERQGWPMVGSLEEKVKRVHLLFKYYVLCRLRIVDTESRPSAAIGATAAHSPEVSVPPASNILLCELIVNSSEIDTRFEDLIKQVPPEELPPNAEITSIYRQIIDLVSKNRYLQKSTLR
jgi:hypothetical protein